MSDPLNLSTPLAPPAVQTASTDLVLAPPAPVPVVEKKQAEGMLPVEPTVQQQLHAKAAAFVEDLMTVDVRSPEFGQKVAFGRGGGRAGCVHAFPRDLVAGRRPQPRQGHLAAACARCKFFPKNGALQGNNSQAWSLEPMSACGSSQARNGATGKASLQGHAFLGSIPNVRSTFRTFLTSGTPFRANGVEA